MSSRSDQLPGALDGGEAPRLMFRNTMRITKGHADDYRQAITEAVAFAERNAPQIMVDVFIDDAEETATSFQIYPDSDAVLRHWQLSDPYIAQVMEHCTVERFEVFGSPSDDVRAGLGQTSGMDVAIQPRLTGYLEVDRTSSNREKGER